jgi:protein TonB
MRATRLAISGNHQAESLVLGGEWVFPESSIEDWGGGSHDFSYDPTASSDEGAVFDDAPYDYVTGDGATIANPPPEQDLRFPDSPSPEGPTPVSLRGRLPRRGETLAAIISSLALHTAALAVFSPAWFSPNWGGLGGELGPVIAVRLMSDFDATPDQETPASRDSPASAASVSGGERAPVVLSGRPPQERPPENDAQSASSPAPFVHNLAEHKEPKEHSEDRERSAPRLHAAHAPDSVPSAPSVASEERRVKRSGGSGNERFKALLLTEIHKAAYYPKRAFAERKHGETLVAFTIHREGTVSDVRIRRSSGSEALDEAALKIVRRASKRFPPLPKDTAADHARYEVPIIFGKEGF